MPNQEEIATDLRAIEKRLTGPKVDAKNIPSIQRLTLAPQGVEHHGEEVGRIKDAGTWMLDTAKKGLCGPYQKGNPKSPCYIPEKEENKTTTRTNTIVPSSPEIKDIAKSIRSTKDSSKKVQLMLDALVQDNYIPKNSAARIKNLPFVKNPNKATKTDKDKLVESMDVAIRTKGMPKNIVVAIDTTLHTMIDVFFPTNIMDLPAGSKLLGGTFKSGLDLTKAKKAYPKTSVAKLININRRMKALVRKHRTNEGIITAIRTRTLDGVQEDIKKDLINVFFQMSATYHAAPTAGVAGKEIVIILEEMSATLFKIENKYK